MRTGTPSPARAAGTHSTWLPTVLYNSQASNSYLQVFSGRILDAVAIDDIVWPAQEVQICLNDRCIQPDSNGNYAFIGVITGMYTVTITGASYYPLVSPVTIPVDGNLVKNYALSPLLTFDGMTMRVVLTWNATPAWPDPLTPGLTWDNNLDSHLWMDTFVPPVHVGYLIDPPPPRFNYGDCYDFPSACLQANYISGSGPETIGFHKPEYSDYYYGVFNYNQYRSGVPPITSTQAEVQVYELNRTTTFRVPETGTGNLWLVFKLTVNDNGTEFILTPLNCITSMPTANFLPQCPP